MTGGRTKPNYRNDVLIQIISELKPTGALMWQHCAELYKTKSGELALRDYADIKRHWATKLCNKMLKPTGKSGGTDDSIRRCQKIQLKILKSTAGRNVGQSDDDDDDDDSSDDDDEDDEDDEDDDVSLDANVLEALPTFAQRVDAIRVAHVTPMPAPIMPTPLMPATATPAPLMPASEEPKKKKSKTNEKTKNCSSNPPRSSAASALAAIGNSLLSGQENNNIFKMLQMQMAQNQAQAQAQAQAQQAQQAQMQQFMQQQSQMMMMMMMSAGRPMPVMPPVTPIQPMPSTALQPPTPFQDTPDGYLEMLQEK